MSLFSIDEICGKIEGFYSNYNQESEQFLLNLQKSDEGWYYAQELLKRLGNPQFFGGSILSYKINHDFDKLSPEEKRILVDSIIAALKTTTLKSVRHKLEDCLVMAALRTQISLSVLLESICQPLLNDSESLAALNISCQYAERIMSSKIKNGLLITENRESSYQLLLALLNSSNPEIVEAWLQCFNVWFISLPIELLKIPQELINFVLFLLSQEMCFVDASTLMIELIDAHSCAAIKPLILELVILLDGDWADSRLKRSIDSPQDEELVAWTRFVCHIYRKCFGYIIDSPSVNVNTEKMFSKSLELLSSKGIPGIENDVIHLVADLWMEFLDDLNFAPVESHRSFIPIIKNVVNICIWNCFYPEYSKWIKCNSDEKHRFLVYRRDVSDILESAHLILHNDLFEMILSAVFAFIQERNILGLESSLFCLCACVESANDTSGELDQIDSLLCNSELLPLISSGNDICIKSFLKLVIVLDKFWSEKQYVREVLTFLYGCLSNPELALLSSKAIYVVYSNAKHDMLKNIDQIMAALVQSVHSSLEEGVIEKLIESTCIVIEAINDEKYKSTVLEKMLQLIIGNSSHKISDFETGKLVLLRLLAAAKGLRSISESVSLLDESVDNSHCSDISIAVYTIMCQICDAHKLDPELFNICCKILKIGFCEDTGPFAFGADATASFVFERSVGNENTISALQIAVQLIAYQSNGHIVPSLINFALNNTLNQPIETLDPDVFKESLELLNKAMMVHTVSFFAIQEHQLVQLMQLVIQAIHLKEVFTRRAVIKFILAMAILPEEGMDQLTALFTEFGLPITEATLQVIGNGTRTEMETFGEFLRKLIFAHTRHMKAWMTTALQRPNFPTARIPDKHKEDFINQLIGCRGNAQSKRIIRNFWIEAQGSHLSWT